MKYDIGFIGAGKMGGAIATAVLGSMDGSRILVCDHNEATRRAFSGKGVATCEDPAEVAGNCATVVVAVKPQDFDALLLAIAPRAKASQLYISIAAGKSLATMRSLLGPKPRLVRVMPNLAALVGEGMMVYAPDSSAKVGDIRRVESILSKCGKTLRLEERHFDTVTALSGSGPAFFAYAMKAMADGAGALGLPEEESAMLAMQTMLGTAKYLIETRQDVAAFIKAVCSPKGTTEAGMKVLAKSSVGKTLSRTISAAARRSAELGR